MHSFLPPSGAAAWSKCAMWPTMNAKYEHGAAEIDESGALNAESEEGTAAHWVGNEIYGGSNPAEDSLSPNGVTVTGEMIEGAQLLCGVVNKRIPQGVQVYVEQTVSIRAIHPDCFGTPDYWGAWGTHLDIVDYKFGHRFIDEYWNPQGLLYMLGIISQLKVLPETISFTIVQPRCFYRGEPVRTHTYKLSEATPYLSKLREAAERAYHPQPTATTGQHCEHCPGRHACPTLQKAAYSDAETSTDQQPVELTPQAAALELRMLDKALLRLTARVEGLRELTTANLKAGAHVPHYKLENGRGRVAWTISPEEVIKLGKKHKKQLGVPKVMTPNQAKKLFVDDSFISAYTHYIDGAVRLAEDNGGEAEKVFRRGNTRM